MLTRVEPSVLWREGMFLATQHFQALAREACARAAAGDALGRACTFGIASVNIDESALARDLFSVRDAEVLFRDGTWASFPTTASVEPRTFTEHLTSAELQVWLGIPAARENVPQIATGEASDGRFARYRVELRPAYDENLRDAEQQLEFRLLQARLFFGAEDRSGFECVPFAKIVRIAGRADAVTALSSDWIPPLVACGASSVLMKRLVELDEQARAESRDLAARVPSLTLLSSVEKGVDIAGFLKLQAVNLCVASLDQIARVPQLDPYTVYQELAHCCGHLAAFAPGGAMPALPAYDHEQVDACFGATIAKLGELLGAKVSVPYETVPFKRHATQEGYFECAIPVEWDKPRTIFYLAIEFARGSDDISALVDSGAVKLLSPSQVERVVRGVVPGIGLTPQRTAPLAFPKRPDLHFFRIDTEGASRDVWLEALKARALVILSALDALGDVHFHLYVELVK